MLRFPKFRGFAGSESQLLKTGGRGGSAAKDVAKICTTLWRESDSKIETAVGPFFEVQVGFKSAKFVPLGGERAIRKSKNR